MEPEIVRLVIFEYAPPPPPPPPPTSCAAPLPPAPMHSIELSLLFQSPGVEYDVPDVRKVTVAACEVSGSKKMQTSINDLKRILLTFILLILLV
jgi:hypothetical protein